MQGGGVVCCGHMTCPLVCCVVMWCGRPSCGVVGCHVVWCGEVGYRAIGLRVWLVEGCWLLGRLGCLAAWVVCWVFGWLGHAVWCVHPVVLGAVCCCVLCDVMSVGTM